ncbi:MULTISPECIES: hypothetical protein [unclassified Moraxella]|uniref:hypothetical protein n=1 Tax=unclassified Moraxella TaxID=2685852 RepID=UPI003AF4A3EA
MSTFKNTFENWIDEGQSQQCPMFPVINHEPLTPQDKGRAERLHQSKQRLNDEKRISDWLKIDVMHNQQKLHDDDIEALQVNVEKLQSQVHGLIFVVAGLLCVCVGVVSCLA